MTLTLSDLKSRLNLDISKIKDRNLEELFSLLNSKKIDPNLISQFLKDKIENKQINLENYKTIDIKEVEKYFVKIIKKDNNISDNALMGKIMSQFKSKIDGKLAFNLIKKLRKK